MSDHDESFVRVLSDVIDDADDVVGGLSVKVACRFVSEDDIRVVDECACDSDSLLFAAR